MEGGEDGIQQGVDKRRLTMTRAGSEPARNERRTAPRPAFIYVCISTQPCCKRRQSCHTSNVCVCAVPAHGTRWLLDPDCGLGCGVTTACTGIFATQYHYVCTVSIQYRQPSHTLRAQKSETHQVHAQFIDGRHGGFLGWCTFAEYPLANE